MDEDFNVILKTTGLQLNLEKRAHLKFEENLENANNRKQRRLISNLKEMKNVKYVETFPRGAKREMESSENKNIKFLKKN